MFLCEGAHPLFLQLILCVNADSSAVHASQDVLGKVSFGVVIHHFYAVLWQLKRTRRASDVSPTGFRRAHAAPRDNSQRRVITPTPNFIAIFQH